MRFLPLYLIVLAIVEIMLFMWAGQFIGFWPTILLVLLSAFVGSFLVRAQGMQAWADFQRSAATGEGEVGLAIFTGICLLLAGAFLITPGFLTDTIGLLLLVPPLRQGVYAGLKSRLSGFVTTVNVNGFEARQKGGSTIIDVEGQEVDSPK